MTKPVFCGLTFVAAAMATLVLTSSSANAALIANWKLDETSGQVAVDSISSNNGQLGTTAGVDLEDPTINQTGQFAKAYNFDSTENDRVDVSAHIASFSSLNSGTVTGWFNTSSTERGALFNFGEASTTDRLLLEMLPAGNVRFLVREANSNITDLTSSGPFHDGGWHHFAVTNDGADTKLLIDKVEVPLSTNTDSAAWFNDVSSVSSFTFGYETRSNGQFPFNGLLDDFAVFDHVLTSQQLTNVFDLGAVNYNIPEPSTFALAAFGLLGLIGFGCRRKR